MVGINVAARVLFATWDVTLRVGVTANNALVGCSTLAQRREV
jgi:hypothetical protein